MDYIEKIHDLNWEKSSVLGEMAWNGETGDGMQQRVQAGTEPGPLLSGLSLPGRPSRIAAGDTLQQILHVKFHVSDWHKGRLLPTITATNHQNNIGFLTTCKHDYL